MLRLCLCFVFLKVICGEVRRPPSVTYPKTVVNKYFAILEQFSLFCEGEGIPTPSIRWMKDGVYLQQTNNIKFNTKYGNITFTNTGRPEEGRYQCVVENKWGSSLSENIYIRLAVLGKFQDQGSIVPLRVTEGLSYSLTCDNKPVSIPTGSFSWYMRSTSSNKEITQIKDKNDPRFALDSNGTLHFVNTKLTDNLNGSEYVCAISNEFLRSINLGSEKNLQVVSSGNNIKNLAPEVLSVTSKVEVKIGTTVELKCIFSGLPIPDIKWRGLSGEDLRLSTKYEIKEYNRILKIRTVKESDEGFYTCEGSNNLGRKEQKLFLNVTSEPIWEYPLDNKNAISGQDVEFTCLARPAFKENPLGAPQWFINGKELDITEDARRGRRLSFNQDKTKLTFLQVNKERDLLVLQCNVSNSVGYIFGDAFLNVLDPIRVQVRPLREIIFEYGDILDFTIKATTDPSRTLSRRWFFNNARLIPIERYFTYNETNGDFFFNTSGVNERTIRHMVGNYTCELSHLNERLNVSFSIKLKDLPVTTEVPVNTTVSSKPVQGSSGNMLIIILVIIAIVVLTVVVAAIIFVKRRPPKAVYDLGKEEDKTFNLTPMDELETEELKLDTLNSTFETLNRSHASLLNTSQDYLLQSGTLEKNRGLLIAANHGTLNRSQEYILNTSTGTLDRNRIVGVTVDTNNQLMLVSQAQIDQNQIISPEAQKGDNPPTEEQPNNGSSKSLDKSNKMTESDENLK